MLLSPWHNHNTGKENHLKFEYFGITHPPPAMMDPIAMNEKIATSCQKWMNQAQKKPRVSTMDLLNKYPRTKDITTPTTPYGTP
jgi:hypothetical protein